MKTHSKKVSISFGLYLIVLSFSAIADEAQKAYPEIYPFVPFEVEQIYSAAERFSEDEQFIHNIYDIENLGLNNGKTFIEKDNGEKVENQPWMSTFWPLNKGLIADPDPSANPYNPMNTRRALSWKFNYRKYLGRKKAVHEKINKKDKNDNFLFDSKALSRLAPSEKYDLLLGDTSFDLTNRLWKYMQKWGSKKEYGFLSSLDKVGATSLKLAQKMVDDGLYDSVIDAMPKAVTLRGGLAEHYATELVKEGKYSSIIDALQEGTEIALNEQDNYVLKAKNDLMALWEGICHGWSTAAGIVPRPLHTVEIKIPDGRTITFYPDDLKGLASLLWANSLIQDSKFEPVDINNQNLLTENNEKAVMGGIIMQGLRCNQKRPAKDEWGRFYDAAPDLYSKKLEPRCVGVHPAIWHLGLVNVLGLQGRSFIVERKVKAAVDNHPLSEYSVEYFNPYTGNYGSLTNSIQNLESYDQFIHFRNGKTKRIVGVRMTMKYMDWKAPEMRSEDAPKYDEVKSVPMLYDLELDIDGNIVGGQWRSTEVGKNFLNISANRDQPDFFWAVTKHWKKAGEVKGQSKAYFTESNEISSWEDTSIAPPKDWLEAALAAHSFHYKKTHELGWNEKCELIRKKGTGKGPIVEVPCEFSINKPQPLVNLVNKLIELSRK